MVSTDEIHQKSKRSAQDSPSKTTDTKLNDVMLAMDIADTLRHHRFDTEEGLSPDQKRIELINRLREIYTAQGIDVPEHVLIDGVLAFEQEKFTFQPPKKTFSLRLARLYVNRRKWLPLVLTLGFIFGMAGTINYLGFERPRQLEARETEVLLKQTLPAQIKNARDDVLSIAKTDDLKTHANQLYNLTARAINNGNKTEAIRNAQLLENYANELKMAYDIRIVYGNGRDSGFVRFNNDEREIRNYYLIVEGVLPNGDLAEILITSEEDSSRRRTQSWAVRVPKTVFDQIVDDKQDDQILSLIHI